MMKNSNGVTMMNLVITIVVMIILISVSGYYSIDSIKNAYTSRQKREFASVVDYTATLKAKMLVDEFSPSNETIISVDTLTTIATGLSETSTNKIIAVNESDILSAKYKYHYITPEKLQDTSFSNDFATVRDAENNYIINFYTGTVIGLYDQGKRVEISGIVKGTSDITLEFDEQ